MIIKMTDVETHINPRNVDIGDIGSRFYTEDENTAFIRIRINYNGSPVDLTKTDMKPKLDLFMEDGSVFIDEKIEVLIPESGLIQYDIPSNVIKHIGKVNCKLFMNNLKNSVHVANFSFGIVSSGIEKAVSKEINLNLVKNTVKQILSEDLTTLLDNDFKSKLTNDLESYISTRNEEFKGEKGDKGDMGERGPKGEKGDMGPQGLRGLDGANGAKGDIGPRGPIGLKGDTGPRGEQGLQGPRGETGPKGEKGEQGPRGIAGLDGKDSTQKNYKDIKIIADIPLKFEGYDELTVSNNVTYYYPQGLALDDDYYYILYDTPELVSRLLIIYDKDFEGIAKYYVGDHGGENIHVQWENGTRYLYAKKDTDTLGKYDITNIRKTEKVEEILPEKEFKVSLYTNFFKTRDGWGLEARNLSKGVKTQRDTLCFYNNDFSKMTGYLWINPSNSTLWSNQLIGSITNHSAKKQGMAIIGNDVFQSVGGNWNPMRDTETHNYHLQGIQRLGANGNVVADYTYHPRELFEYLKSLGKNPDVIEHESLFVHNEKVYCMIVYSLVKNEQSSDRGLLIVEYGSEDKEYTFTKKGNVFTTPTSNYNPYKPNIDGYLYNEYTGEKISDIKSLTKYLTDTCQSKVILYTSNVKINDYYGNLYPSNIKITLENLNNYTYFLNCENNGVSEKYIITRDNNDNFNLVSLNKDKRYDGFDLLDVSRSMSGYSINTKNTPDNVSLSGWFNFNIESTYKKVTYQPYNSYDIYINIYVNSTWQGWKKLQAVDI